MVLDKNAIAKRWREMGYSCDLWVDPPGRTWEDFVHDTDEKVYVPAIQLKISAGRLPDGIMAIEDKE